MRAEPARHVSSDDSYNRSVDPRTVAIEHAVAMIEAAVGGLARDQRIDVTRAVDWVIDEVPRREYY